MYATMTTIFVTIFLTISKNKTLSNYFKETTGKIKNTPNKEPTRTCFPSQTCLSKTATRLMLPEKLFTEIFKK